MLIYLIAIIDHEQKKKICVVCAFQGLYQTAYAKWIIWGPANQRALHTQCPASHTARAQVCQNTHTHTHRNTNKCSLTVWYLQAFSLIVCFFVICRSLRHGSTSQRISRGKSLETLTQDVSSHTHTHIQYTHTDKYSMLCWILAVNNLLQCFLKFLRYIKKKKKKERF